jgi:hypothetical protein
VEGDPVSLMTTIGELLKRKNSGSRPKKKPQINICGELLR